MAIDRCENDHVFNRDWNTECPRCLMAAIMPSTVQRVEIAEDGTVKLIRHLRDTTNDRRIYDECKRVLGEA